MGACGSLDRLLAYAPSPVLGSRLLGDVDALRAERLVPVRERLAWCERRSPAVWAAESSA